MKRFFAGLGIVLSLAARADGIYEDEILSSTDPSVRRIVLPTGFVYVFTNTSGTVSCTLKDDVTVFQSLVVAGGGAGGYGMGGGGGGGGVVNTRLNTSCLAGETIQVIVGAGGRGGNSPEKTEVGQDSLLTLGDVTTKAKGGGRGGSYATWQGVESYVGGSNGGSGGGGTYNRSNGMGTDGQGCAGATARGNRPGGGGGAAHQGYEATSVIEDGKERFIGGHGGEGVTNDITGTVCVYGSGGGGGCGSASAGTVVTFYPGDGGTNAGSGGARTAAVDGFGGGGGGGQSGGGIVSGGNGGSGTVILRLLPSRMGIVTIVPDADVPESAVSTGYGTVVAVAGSSESIVLGFAEDPETKVKSIGDGYYLEEYDAATDSWSAPREGRGATFALSSAVGRCLRFTAHWAKTLGGDAVYSDRAIESTSTPTRYKVDGRYVYVFADTSSDATVILKAAAEINQSLVVAGGGAGGWNMGGGGGGGGVVHMSEIQDCSAGDVIRLRVGAGGTAGMPDETTNGSSSWLKIAARAKIEAVGGGRGGNYATWAANNGVQGGSGGGGALNGLGGLGVEGQGFSGAAHDNKRPGGGGGASHAGYPASSNAGGNGGDGLSCDITGEVRVYGSGGGGGRGTSGGVTTDYAGLGGTNAGNGGGGSAVDGFGGGGGGGTGGVATENAHGGNGGAGTVILSLALKFPLGLGIILR